MKATVDTNVLVRVFAGDDEKQSLQAMSLLRTAELIVLTLSMLCETVWVLRTNYRMQDSEIVDLLVAFLGIGNLVFDRDAVNAGLEMLRNGGDFADGVIAFEGRRLGGDVFVSFDRKAVKLLVQQGFAAQHPS